VSQQLTIGPAPDVRPVAGGGRAVKIALVATALAYVGVLVGAPLIGILWTVVKSGFSTVTTTLTQTDVRHAFWLTFVIAVIAVSVTTSFGVVVAWVLSRHSFPGRRLLYGLVDLPLALSPVTVGLMVVVLFGRGGWFEPFLASQGIQVIFALPSMILVTAFVSIPFVIRSVAPVLEEIGTSEEEAAQTLGASSLKTFFRVTLPNVRWGLAYGIALSTARALGEIGAVLIVSGAIQGRTETATLYILRALEERQDAQGYVVALALAAVSITILLTIELLRKRSASARGEST
jgi:sulfate/thiosulfate transport system permease protein